MTINGTDITTLGMRLSSVSGLHDLPKQKDILPYWSNSTALTVHEEFPVTFRLIGKFATSALLKTAVTRLKTLLTTTVIQEIADTNLTIDIRGVIKDGIQTRVYGPQYQMLEVQFKLYVTL